MRIIIFLLLVAFITNPLLAQVPGKKEMQGQMLEAVNELRKTDYRVRKQIAEAKKRTKVLNQSSKWKNKTILFPVKPITEG